MPTEHRCKENDHISKIAKDLPHPGTGTTCCARARMGAYFSVWNLFHTSIDKKRLPIYHFDEEGKARIEDIPGGQSQVSFPGLHGDEWKSK